MGLYTEYQNEEKIKKSSERILYIHLNDVKEVSYPDGVSLFILQNVRKIVKIS